MKVKNYFVLLLSLVFMCLHSASASVGTRGGGSDLGLEFQAAFETSLKNIKNQKEFSDLSSLDFKILLPNLKIVVVEEILETKIGNSYQESTAVNYPKNQLIKLNKDRWSSIANAALKEGLALHEVLSLVGKEGSGNYQYSALYVAKYGVSVTDLRQSFEIKRKSRSYNYGKDKFTIIATERWIDYRLFDKILIEYSVLKNGKVLLSKNSVGGIMYSCVGYDPSYGPLPEDFLEVINVDNNEFGFLVKGLEACANARSMKYQIIVPSTKDLSYEVKEISTVAEPKLRVSNNGLEFWYISQSWGISWCGALSFYIPSVFLITRSDTYSLIKSSKLPTDISLIPTFPPFEMENYMSLYAAGIITRDGGLMKMAVSYMKEDSLFRYQECGFPTSKVEAIKKANAMNDLEISLKSLEGLK